MCASLHIYCLNSNICAVCRSYRCACAANKCPGTRRRLWEFPFRYGVSGSVCFLPISKPLIAQSLAPMAVMAGQSSGGGAPVTIVLLCACAMLLLASGIEPNQGPETPRVDLPTPCDEPMVTPHRRATTKSVSDDAGAAPPVNCMQCNRPSRSPDQPTIKCSICGESMHLCCLKAGKYLDGRGWRKQEPP